MNLSVSGERIKEMRKLRGLTQTELASKLLGIDTDRGKSKISEYEHGKNLTLKNIQELAKALDCDPDYLLGCIDHPDVTTSWIAEKIPLSRRAIEALQNMQFQLKEWSDFDAMLITSILDGIIIHLEESLQGALIDENGKLIEYDDFLSNAADMLTAYESIAASESEVNAHKMEKLAIRGTSAWIGSDLAEVVRKTIKDIADPHNKVKSEEV